jgi:uncharacterized protein (DUF1501 family)
MKDKVNTILSRRALLRMGVRSLAGAGLLGTLEQAARANSKAEDRALVCIYLFGGEGGGARLPEVPELKALHRKRVLAIVKNVAQPSRNSTPADAPGDIMKQRCESLRFLPNGFATLEWAARMAGIDPLTGEGAFTFQSGMSMVSLDGHPREGAQFENAALRQAMNAVPRVRTSFPDTPLGRQLKDVTRLLQAGRTLDLHRPVFLCAGNGFTGGAERAGTIAARYHEIGQAMAAFYRATVELGLERRVTTYTDAEFSTDRSAPMNARLVLGGAVMDSDVPRSETLGADTYSGSLARWHGLPVRELMQWFPEFELLVRPLLA